MALGLHLCEHTLAVVDFLFVGDLLTVNNTLWLLSFFPLLPIALRQAVQLGSDQRGDVAAISRRSTNRRCYALAFIISRNNAEVFYLAEACPRLLSPEPTNTLLAASVAMVLFQGEIKDT